MTSFDERERRFESKFANDAEARFRVEARRDKIVGAWAADRLGLTGEKATEYARSVVRADLEEPGDDDVFRKLRADLPPSVSDETIREQMSHALEEAMNQDGKS